MTRSGWIALAFGAAAFGPLATAQQSAQIFDAPVVAVPSLQQRMDALLDVNGDGFHDAVGATNLSFDKFGVHLFVNDGSGRLAPTFTESWITDNTFNSLPQPTPVAVADFNQDGLDDFVVAVIDEARVYLSNGAAAPTLANQFALDPTMIVQHLVAGDFDGNGSFDVAVDARNPFNGVTQIGVYFAPLQPDGGTNLVADPSTSAWSAMRVAEVNGDSIDDIVQFGGGIRLVRVANGQLVVTALTTGVGGAGDAGDIDGDNDVDLVIFQATGHYQVLRRTGPSTFNAEPAKAGGPATHLADYDNDGDLDGVCCGGGGPPNYTYTEPSLFELAANDGTGAFAPSMQLPGLASNHIAGVADLDHDGDNDLVAGRVVFYNIGGFRPMLPPFPQLTQLFQPSLRIAQSDLVDVDGDGDVDAWPQVVNYFRTLGDGTGATTPRVTIAPPEGTFGGFYRGDFDADGDDDIAVTTFVGGQSAGVRLLKNNGGGGLSDGGLITAPGAVFSNSTDSRHTFLGDFDGDGDVDVLAFDEPLIFGPVIARLWLKQATGLYTMVSEAMSRRAIGVADVDGDGNDDALLASGSAIEIMWGGPTPVLSGASVLITQPGGTGLINSGVANVADLDSDGDLDILLPIAPAPGAKLRAGVLENVASRSFAVHDMLFPEYQAISSIPASIGDVNADGSLDVILKAPLDPMLLAPVADNNTFLVYLGSAAPGLDFTLAAHQYPATDVLVDLDGDGDADGLSSVSSTVSHPFAANSTPILSRARYAPLHGLRKQYGAATNGALGQQPTFGASGPFLPSSPIELRITGAAPNAPAILLVGIDDQAAKLGGSGGFIVTLPLIVALNVILPGNSSESGSGHLTLPVVVPAPASGLSFYHQVIVIDPAGQGGVALSNGLELRYGL